MESSRFVKPTYKESPGGQHAKHTGGLPVPVGASRERGKDYQDDGRHEKGVSP